MAASENSLAGASGSYEDRAGAYESWSIEPLFQVLASNGRWTAFRLCASGRNR
jgi:hypothetical protein